MLILEHVTKQYPGSGKGIFDLSLHICPGDIYAFLGCNGAGKTTTLKAVAGIHSIDSGRILIDGTDIREDPLACRRAMAYIPDNPDLYDYLTGVQYLQFAADVYGVPTAERRQRISRYAEQLEFSDGLGDLISSYSHGMKQKLALISAFVHQPRLLLLDEPFVGLDPVAAVTLRRMMQELCDQGSAIFYSTHVLETAQKLGTKAAIINDGRILLSGSMDQLLRSGHSLEDTFLEVTGHGK